MGLFDGGSALTGMSVQGTSDGGSGMGEPGDGVAADAAIALGNVRPVDVLSQPEEHTWSFLVCAPGRRHLFTLAE